MRLHLDKELFRQAVQFTSDQLQIPAIYVEKDYWVTYALFNIFQNEIGKTTIFKGGTSLSKCYNVIERFSEDIDLVILKEEGESGNSLKKKIKKINSVVSELLPEVEVPGLTHKMGMIRKTAHSFNKEFQGHYGQVRDAIVIEATWLGYFEPYTTKKVCSFVGQMMLDNNQEEIATQNNLLPFEVLVLEPTRTICEKIMSLVRFSHSDNAIDELKNKIRHVYDLYQLLSKKEFSNFFNSDEFNTLLLKVAQDDVQSFKNNNKWLQYHPSEAIVFKDYENVWKQLKSTYLNEFQNLVYGNLPSEIDLLETLKAIKTRLSKINWSIDLES